MFTVLRVFIPDGLFGQCRSSKQDQVQYQVSVPVLKRMQEVLKQLMLQGEQALSLAFITQLKLL